MIDLFPYYREHFEEAMKYACRSVSDQDIGCYEMFLQVCIVILTKELQLISDSKTCNNLMVSGITSSSLRAILPLAVFLPQQQAAIQGLQTTLCSTPMT